MKKEDKAGIVESLAERLTNARNFYVTDVSTLTVAQTNNLRRLCFDRGIEMTMVKNTLIRKALEKAQIIEPNIAPALKGSSSLMFSDSFTAPAKLIKDFRKKNPRPLLKAAYIEQSLYVGDQELDTL
ncbi:MAG: 50S ribosomal protein L10, partial [Bacteroidota bacterium]|nr:50S ribosomal protein L10 [Bacteroidota bacterium]